MFLHRKKRMPHSHHQISFVVIFLTNSHWLKIFCLILQLSLAYLTECLPWQPYFEQVGDFRSLRYQQ